MSTETEHELLFPPTDGVSGMHFAHGGSQLLVASWDNGVRLYEASKNQVLQKYDHEAGALDCCFSGDDTQGFSGGVDQKVMACDLETGKARLLGSHGGGVRCVLYSEVAGAVVSGGWDCAVKLWDPRADKPMTSSYEQPGKVFAMDAFGDRLVVGTSDRHVLVYDLRNLASPEQRRKSSLMHQTRAIRCFPNGRGYALSSIEGRVAIEYFDPSDEAQKRKYAFKCHRSVQDGVQTLYPVTGLAFHPVYGTFATGGGDGKVNVWDGENRKRICQYPTYPTSIAALDFNHDGSILAVAASYTFEEGDKDHPSDSIYIRKVNANEVRPKSRGKV